MTRLFLTLLLAALTAATSHADSYTGLVSDVLDENLQVLQSFALRASIELPEGLPKPRNNSIIRIEGTLGIGTVRSILRAQSWTEIVADATRIAGQKKAVIIPIQRIEEQFAFDELGFKQRLAAVSESVTNYYAEVSSGAFGTTFEIRDVLRLPISTDECPVVDREAFMAKAAAAAGIQRSAYDFVLFVFDDWNGCNKLVDHSGQDMGSRESFYQFKFSSLASDSELQQRYRFVFAHEIGHSIGLDHANFFECPNGESMATSVNLECTSYNYANFLDLMGGALNNSLLHVGMAAKAALGWTQSTEVAEVQAGGVYELNPAEIGTGKVRALKIPVGRIDIKFSSGYIPPFDGKLNFEATHDLWIQMVSPIAGHRSALHDVALVGYFARRHPRYISSDVSPGSVSLERTSGGFIPFGRDTVEPVTGLTLRIVSAANDDATGGLRLGVQVCFRGESCPGNAIEKPAPTPTPTPIKPRPFAVKALAVKGKLQVSLSWTEVPGATSYQLIRKGGKEKRRAVHSTSFVDRSVKAGVRYTYSVVALRDGKPLGTTPAKTITVARPRR